MAHTVVALRLEDNYVDANEEFISVTDENKRDNNRSLLKAFGMFT